MNVPILRADGFPVHTLGLTASPGLYVAGYPWLSTRGSGILYGVAADAARIAQHIAATRRGNQTWTQLRATLHAALTRTPAQPLRLDRLIRARAIHSMTGQTYRCVGLYGARIAAVSADPHGLDDLAGPARCTVDAADLTVLPAFSDSHEHLMEASRNTLLVPVDQARSIAEFTGMISDAARDAAPGAWIVTSMGWHESNLAENRLPTGAELDAAAPAHPGAGPPRRAPGHRQHRRPGRGRRRARHA